MVREAMRDMHYRSYQRSDLDAMYALDKMCFEEPFRFSRAMVKRSAEADNALIVVAERGVEIAGFGIVHVQALKAGPVGYLVTLDVAESERRRGVACMILIRLEAAACAQQCDAMLLHVFSGNEGAIRFYEALGYRRVGNAREFYGAGLDAWVYRKPLSDEAG
jgi:ribosomal-protein-alanine N-acetyltransferase